jgi:hypothetical protein
MRAAEIARPLMDNFIINNLLGLTLPKSEKR